MHAPQSTGKAGEFHDGSKRSYVINQSSPATAIFVVFQTLMLWLFHILTMIFFSEATQKERRLPTRPTAIDRNVVMNRCCHVLIAAMLTMIAACGGGGGGGATSGTLNPGAGQAAGDYFPLGIGDRWTYKQLGVNTTARVTGTRIAQGVNATVVRVDDASGTSEDLYLKTATGVMAVAPDGSDEVVRALATVPVLKLPIVAGSSQVALNQTFTDYGDFDSDGRADPLTLRVDTSVIGFETLSTTAGTLTSVAHTRTVLTVSVKYTSNGKTVQSTTTSDDWFAPDIGPVRNVTTSASSTSQNSEQILVAYRIGSRHSETIAPTVSGFTPAEGSLGLTATISVHFSEAMDRLAGGNHGLNVTINGVNNITGTFAWMDDTSLEFRPVTPLVVGSYTVKLDATIEDLAGNSLATPQTWHFNIDTAGPKLLASTPVSGSKQFPLNGVITLTFDKDLDVSTVTTSSFTLYESKSSQLVPVNVSLSGRTVTLTPMQPLTRAGNYQVAVYETLKDAQGNAFIPANIYFSSDTGRFDAPYYAPGLSNLPDHIAVGDFNGDGRTDLAVIGLGVGADSTIPKLRIFYRRADGTLADPVVVASTVDCLPFELLAGDVDGDGLTDLVVGGYGPAVLKQTTAGTLIPQYLSNKVIKLLAIVPQSTNGRMAVLVQESPFGVNQLVLWAQDSSGGFSRSANFPQVMNYTNSAAVADFDGDGRADFVFSGNLTSTNGNGLAVLHQEADGSFGRLLEMPLTLSLPTNDVAAGDINGDGRPDIVFSTGGNSPTFIGIVMQRSDGSFGPMSSLPTYDIPESILVADVTADGRADVLVAHGGWQKVGVYIQAADGTLGAEQLFDAPSCSGSYDNLAVGDLNGDGLIDIAHCGAVLYQRPLSASGTALASGVRSLWQRARPPKSSAVPQ